MGVKVIRPSGRKDWYIQVCEGGERYLRHAGSREAAFAAKKEIEASLAAGTFRKPEKKAEKGITFGEAAKRWKKEHVDLRLKPSTKKYYADLIEAYLNPYFESMPLAEITRRNVKEAVAFWVGRAKASDSKRGERSIPNALRTGGALLSWAIEEELATVNPFLNPGKVFKVESFKGDYLRPEEVIPYLNAVKKKAPRYYPILRTMLYAGLRVGEAVALKWGCIDWNGKFLSVQESSWQGILGTPKTKSSIRRVDLSSETLAILEQHRKAVAAQSLKAGRSMPEEVFVNEPAKAKKGKEADARGGKPMDPSKIRRAHELALKEAGIRHIRIHDLRGTYTALAVSAGVPIYFVSKSLGHSDTATTERNYADLVPGAARETPNVMERYIQRETVRNANQMRTEGIEGETPLSGESVSA
jgi:Site-specific recombinase XerD